MSESWVTYLREHPEITTEEIMNRATDRPPLQVVGTDELEPQIDYLYEHGRDPGMTTGWASLDMFLRLSKGNWTLVTGWPGHGKSGVVDNIAVNTMRLHDWKWLFFSAENLPYESHWAGLAELYARKPFNRGFRERMTPADLSRAKGFLSEHCWHIHPDEGLTVNRILDIAAEWVAKRAIDAIVIDPWNELDHGRPVGVMETEYVSNALSLIRRFARAHNVHVFVVAHPTKLGRDRDGKLPVPTPHDCQGSSHFWKKADNAICVYRTVENGQTDTTEILVQKVRFRWHGRIGSCHFTYDAVTGAFIERPS